MIATFYSETVVWSGLAAAGVVLAALVGLNAAGVTRLWPYLTGGIILWFFVHQSGIHATLAGVALAMAIPSRTCIDAAEFSREARLLLDRFDQTETGDLAVLTSKGQQDALFALDQASAAVTAPILLLEHALHRFSAFVVMPIFAFANAGVRITGIPINRQVAVAVVAGLLLGKPLGITTASWFAVKLRIATLPTSMSWRMLHGVAWLGGIGFTMSLFITMLAFTDPAAVDAAKLATLSASVVAGIVAAVVFNAGRPKNVSGSDAVDPPAV